MNLRTVGFRSAAGLAVLGLAACAGAPSTPSATPVSMTEPGAAASVAGSLPASRLPTVLAAFNARLTAMLDGRLAGVVRLQAEQGSAHRVIFDVGRSFEAGSAQLRPELLLPLSEIASASLDGVWVIHVIGHAERAEDRSLAERRATAVASYLGRQGLSGGRLRSEARSEPEGSGHQLELVFVAVVEGRELRAWMPPDRLAPKR